MSNYIILLWSLSIRTCFGQLKPCYQAVEGQVSGDFPCNPEANVSSCCAPGNICSSNLFCIAASNHQNYVGTCTDRTWSSPACPFNLTSGVFDPDYDKFSYALNTTQCPDGTLCPLADNQECCDAKRGIEEIQFHYNGSAVMPADTWELCTFYSAAGYAFPTSSHGSTLSPATQVIASSTNLNLTLSTSISNKSTDADARELITVSATIDYTIPTSKPSGYSVWTYPPPPAFRGSTEFSTYVVATTTTPTNSATPSTEPSKPSSSRGAGIGIGTGIGLSVAVCGVCAVLLLLRMRRRPQRRQLNHVSIKSASPTAGSVRGIGTEMEGTPADEWHRVHELDNRSLKEM